MRPALAAVPLLAALAARPAGAQPPATADDDPGAEADADARAWHAGLNLRPELAVHPLRIDGGVRFCRLDTILVLDPLFFTDGVFDLDLLAEWHAGTTYSLLGGWRTTRVALDGDAQHHERLLLGAAARLPSLAGGRIRPHVGVELGVLLLKHGGGLRSEGLPLDRTVLGHLSAGAFLRIEFAHGL